MHSASLPKFYNHISGHTCQHLCSSAQQNLLTKLYDTVFLTEPISERAKRTVISPWIHQVIPFTWLCIQCFNFYNRNSRIVVMLYYFISSTVGIRRKFREDTKAVRLHNHVRLCSRIYDFSNDNTDPEIEVA